MGTYRVFFRNASNIVGRFDLTARDDQAAIALAEVLCEACSDQCDAFEVWNGDHCLHTGHSPRSPLGAREILEKAQVNIIEHEEAIRRSQWAIAGSHKLLARLNEARAQSGSVGHRASERARDAESFDNDGDGASLTRGVL